MSTTIEEIDEKKEDFLEQDPQIPGQNYCCLSFLSPEKFILAKYKFEFFKFYEKLTTSENIKKSLDDDLTLKNFEDKMENFLVANKTELEKQYNEHADFRTSVRGLKVRGTYETEREAKIRAEVLRRRFPNDNVFVGQVGYWLPWDPNPLDVKNLEYQETELNTLMKKYYENMEQRENMFEEERRTKMYKDKKKNIPTKEEEKETQDKFGEFRDILDEKDGVMKSSDPWMERKDAEKKGLLEPEPEVSEPEPEVLEPEPEVLEPEPEPEVVLEEDENSSSNLSPSNSPGAPLSRSNSEV